MRKLRNIKLILSLVVSGGVFLFFLLTDAEAGNTGRPLHTWAQTQVTVSNRYSANVAEIDISYNLTSLWSGIEEYRKLHGDDSINLWDNPDNPPYHYNSREDVYKALYFWVVMYSIGRGESVKGDNWPDDEGMGEQRIGGYYWGLFAKADGKPLHCYLTIPKSYGTGQYRVEVLTRLGPYDYSHFANDGTIPTNNDTPSYLRSSEFTVSKFITLPIIQSGVVTMSNPDRDSTIEINIPAYSTFTDYNSQWPPFRYMIEISELSSFPWSEPPESPRKTIYAYPLAKDEPMSVYVSVSELNHSKSTFYGRIRCLGPDGEHWPERIPTTIGNVNVTNWTTLLPNVDDYSVANIGEDTTVEVTITSPKYSDFIAIAQAKNPKVNIYLVHSTIYSKYDTAAEQEGIMTVIYDPAHADYNKIRPIPVDIPNQTTALTVNALVDFKSTGTYYICARSSADGFTPGRFSAYEPTTITVDHLTTQLATIPSAKWTIDNTGEDKDISVSINHYSEFIGTSDMHSAYEVKVTSGTKTGYAYVSVVTTAGQKTTVYLDLTKISDGKGGTINFVATVPVTINLNVRCVKDGMTPGAYNATDKTVTINYNTTRLPNVTNYSVANIGEDTTVEVTIASPKYSDFIAIAQTKNPKVNIYLVHDSIYSTYQSNQEEIMTVIYDPGHAHYSKIKPIPVDILNQATPIRVNALVPFEATGIYHVCARSSADGFTPGAFSGWQATNIQVDHLTTQLATIPDGKWRVDNTGQDAHISLSINPYQEFIGTHDMHNEYEIKVTDGTKTGYVYVPVEEPTQSININLDLCEMNDGSGGFINLVATVPATLKVTARCLADGMTPGEWSAEKTIIINYAASADFDWDGDVDWGDLAIMSSHWLGCTEEKFEELLAAGAVRESDRERMLALYDEDVDLNHDGIINLVDFAILANLWNPRPPSDLSAQAVSSTRINLSWQDNTDGEGGFKIQRQIGTTGAFVVLPITPPVGADVTTYTDTGLEPGQTYSYRIYAYAYNPKIGYSTTGFSNIAGVTTPINHPPVVSTIPNQIILQGEDFATINLDNYVEDIHTPDSQLSWEVSGATQLDVYIGGDRVATITYPEGWTGLETVNFIAEDPDGLSDSTEVTFIVAMDSKKIQNDINLARSGSTVPVQSGIYKLTSNLNIAKAVTLKTIDPDPDNTILILGDYSIIVKFPQPPADYPLEEVTIEGVTITGYTGRDKNGPIQNYWANLTLKNCKIMDNKGIKVSAIYNSWYSTLNLDNTLIAKNINIPSNDIYQYGYSPFRGYLWGELYCGTIYLDWFSKLYVNKSTIADNINASMPITIQTGYGETGYGQTGYGTRKLNIVYGAIQRTMSNRVEMTNSIMWKNGRWYEKDFSYILPYNQIRIITNSDIQNLGIITPYDYINDVIKEDPLFDPEDLDYLPHNETCIDREMGVRF